MNQAHSAAMSARPASLAYGVVMVYLPAEVAPSVPQVVLSTNHARADVPDHEDAVYHPAMSAFTWFTAALEALLDAEALVVLMRRRWQEIENRREPLRQRHPPDPTLHVQPNEGGQL